MEEALLQVTEASLFSSIRELNERSHESFNALQSRLNVSMIENSLTER